MTLVVRTSGNPADMIGSIRQAVQKLDRDQVPNEIATMQEVMANSIQTQRFSMFVLGGFAFLALTLAAVGIYGVMSYVVGQRTQEMGIRIALGAPHANVVRVVVSRAAKFAATGAVAGVMIALMVTRSLSALLYGISARDPVTFIAVPLLFLLIAAVASYAPARRATRVDPVTALRAD
jgi:putative ABC transport system permease protein